MGSRKYKVSSVLALLFLVLFGGSAFLNYKLATYLNEYEDQIERQDSMINKLSFSNDLVNEYFNINEDSITHTKTYSLKEEKREKEIQHVTKYIDHVFIRDGKEMSSDELVAAVNASDRESAETIKSLVDKYNTLINDNKELWKKYCDRNDSVITQGMALGLIKRNYGIDYVSNLNGDKRTVKIFGERVDSALLLLPYYRHKLSYDPLKKVWIVEYDKMMRK